MTYHSRNPVKMQFVISHRKKLQNGFSGISLMMKFAGEFIAQFTTMIEVVTYIMKANSSNNFGRITLEESIETNCVHLHSS